MIKDWININDVESMLKLGKFTYVRKLIKEDLKELQEKNCSSDISIFDTLNITSNKTKDLIEKIKILKVTILKNYSYTLVDSTHDNNIKGTLINEYENEYFLSEAHQLIYYLTNLDGEEQMEKLKIYKAHYFDKKLAATWYHNILNKIHPDKLNGLMINNTEKAIENLKEIYGGMKVGDN